MKGRIFRLLGILTAVLAGAYGLSAAAQDYGPPAGVPGGFSGQPSAAEIQQLMQQAQSQAQSQGQDQGLGAGAPGGMGMPAGQNFGPPPGVADMQAKGEEMAKQGAAKQLKGLQQGAKGMENGIKQFEALVKKAEKAGSSVSAEIKQKYSDLKEHIQKIKNAKSADEIEGIDTDSMQSDINEVMEAAGTAIQSAEQLKGLKQGIKGMEQGLKSFESQLARITKQKATIPAEITEKVASIKAKIAAVKAAKTWEEAEAAGVEELQDSMESLNDYRDQLEVLMRLPQMQKQLDQQMNNLIKELKKTQAIVTKLQKQGIDLNEEQAAFSSAVNQLKTVRDETLAKIKGGNSEEIKTALDDLEENFFGQLQDAWENSRIIQTMSNLGRFQSEFKKSITSAQKQVAQLKKKKINTSELEALIKQSQEKGNAVLALIKVKPVDTDAVEAGISELEDLRTQFTEKVDELSGAAMPWETGPDQFKDVGNYDMSKYMPKQ